jgi:uncharacterized protein
MVSTGNEWSNRGAEMSEQSTDGPGGVIVEEIPESECLQLLAETNFGRLAVLDGKQPVILPVNYTYASEGIVVHTDVGVKIDAGSQHLVAFEIDSIEEGMRTGWSVLVKGPAHDITETIDELSVRLRQTRVDTWSPGEPRRRLVIHVSAVSGRRLRREVLARR